ALEADLSGLEEVPRRRVPVGTRGRSCLRQLRLQLQDRAEVEESLLDEKPLAEEEESRCSARTASSPPRRGASARSAPATSSPSRRRGGGPRAALLPRLPLLVEKGSAGSAGGGRPKAALVRLALPHTTPAAARPPRLVERRGKVAHAAAHLRLGEVFGAQHSCRVLPPRREGPRAVLPPRLPLLVEEGSARSAGGGRPKAALVRLALPHTTPAAARPPRLVERRGEVAHAQRGGGRPKAALSFCPQRSRTPRPLRGFVLPV